MPYSQIKIIFICFCLPNVPYSGFRNKNANKFISVPKHKVEDCHEVLGIYSEITILFGFLFHDDILKYEIKFMRQAEA